MSEAVDSIFDEQQAKKETERRLRAEARQRETERVDRIRMRIGDAMHKWPSSNEPDELSRFFMDEDHLRRAAAEIVDLMQWLKANADNLERRISDKRGEDIGRRRLLALLRIGLTGTIDDVLGNLKSLGRRDQNYRLEAWIEWFDLYRWWQWTDPFSELLPSGCRPMLPSGCRPIGCWPIPAEQIAGAARESNLTGQHEEEGPVADPDKGRGKPLEESVCRLAPSRRKAYQQYQWAVSCNAALDGAPDRDVYDWLKEKLETDAELPSLANWTRYLRTARKADGTSKHNSRAGRTGRSVVNQNEI
jgi:hypothetical protein